MPFRGFSLVEGPTRAAGGAAAMKCNDNNSTGDFFAGHPAKAVEPRRERRPRFITLAKPPPSPPIMINSPPSRRVPWKGIREH